MTDHQVLPSEREADRPPWEQPGAVRRDSLPHRGRTLLFAGRACMALGVFSIYGGLTAIPAVVIGVGVMVAARRDLAEMEKGLMDPDGALPTVEADWAAMRGLMAVVVCAFRGLGLLIKR